MIEKIGKREKRERERRESELFSFPLTNLAAGKKK